ncbi:MAG: hypothetical protein F6K39_00230 [Okeania sp. SIO3B3]|nr:hypothetical protein [Okeania sp. SIO3B3]
MNEDVMTKKIRYQGYPFKGIKSGRGMAIFPALADPLPFKCWGAKHHIQPTKKKKILHLPASLLQEVLFCASHNLGG